MGPRAVFSTDSLNLGNVYVNTVHYYEVKFLGPVFSIRQIKIKNSGQIAVEFEIVKYTSPLGSKFQFVPSSGKLAVGEERNIEIIFTPDSLGIFSIDFEWNIKVTQLNLISK